MDGQMDVLSYKLMDFCNYKFTDRKTSRDMVTGIKTDGQKDADIIGCMISWMNNQFQGILIPIKQIVSLLLVVTRLVKL
jgi:hypothetical protein